MVFGFFGGLWLGGGGGIGGGNVGGERLGVAEGLEFRGEVIKEVFGVDRGGEATRVASDGVDAIGSEGNGLDGACFGRGGSVEVIGSEWGDVDEIIFANAEPVLVLDEIKADEPSDWFEGSFAFEDIYGEGGVVGEEDLFAATKEFGAIRLGGADATGNWEATVFKDGEIFSGEIDKNVLAVDGEIAFEQALFVGMPEARRLIHVGGFPTGVVVALPMGEGNLPAAWPGFAVGK